MVTQILSMLQSAALAVLAFSGIARPWHVIALAFVQGLINAMDIPARQSFVVEMVDDRADLSNAIAMNSMMFNSARLIGPAIGGYAYARTPSAAYLLAASLFAVAAVAMFLIGKVPRANQVGRAQPLKAIADGMAYVWQNKLVLGTITLDLFAVFLAGTSALPSPTCTSARAVWIWLTYCT